MPRSRLKTEPDVVDRPNDAWPQAPAGFKVELYTTDVKQPRKIITAPNGDFFVAESHDGNIKIFRGITEYGRPQQTAVFATGLNQPYGIAFYPPGPESAVRLHRRYRRDHSCPLFQRRSKAHRQGGPNR